MPRTSLTSKARDLRQSMTEAERRLWRHLRRRNLGVFFRRQAPIGSFIVDFVWFETRLVIELDGGQHAESEEDRVRDSWLESHGFRVLRFWNHEVFGTLEGVIGVIQTKIGAMGKRSS